MKKETLFLKAAVVLIAMPVLAAAILVFPVLVRDAAAGSDLRALVMYGILTIMALTLIPFFFALVQAMKLLRIIDGEEAFSRASVAAIRWIRRSASLISILYLAALPLFYLVGEGDDAPGVILIGAGLIFAPAVIAVFAAVLEKLLCRALDLKQEQDLTI